MQRAGWLRNLADHPEAHHPQHNPPRVESPKHVAGTSRSTPTGGTRRRVRPETPLIRPGKVASIVTTHVKYPLRGSTRWALWEWGDIPSKTDPSVVYLRRLRVVQTPWFSVLVHQIFEPDSDRDPHDHPWSFGSLVVRGGYTEDVSEKITLFGRVVEGKTRNEWPRWSWHRMTTKEAHRITSVLPDTMTLVVTGPRVRTWGFWTDQGFVPWDQYPT